jgi:hypothetical protein
VFTPGSKMPLQKMTDGAQREALIAYLELATEDSPIDGKGSASPDSPAQGGQQ